MKVSVDIRSINSYENDEKNLLSAKQEMLPLPTQSCASINAIISSDKSRSSKSIGVAALVSPRQLIIGQSPLADIDQTKFRMWQPPKMIRSVSSPSLVRFMPKHGSQEERLLYEMNEMYERREIRWGSGVMIGASKILERRKPFHNWLHRNTEEPKIMNCWECVLYSAYRAGIINKKTIKKNLEIVDSDITDNFSHFTIRSFLNEILKKTIKEKSRFLIPKIGPIDIGDSVIPKGYVVIFGDQGQHVGISAGDRNVLELDAGNTVRLRTVEKIMEKPAYSNQIAWGPLL